MDSFQQPFQQQPQTSFIPKKALVVKPEVRQSYGVFLPIAIILFIISVAFYGVTYAYELQLKNGAEKLKENIARQEKAFDPKLLAELQRLDARIGITKDLLGKHITLLPFLDFLATQTIRGVRFTGLTYELGNESSPTVMRLAGEAQDYDAIALQSDVFGASPLLKSFLFSDLILGRAGSVGFSLTLSLDPAIFSYTQAKQIQ